MNATKEKVAEDLRKFLMERNRTQREIAKKLGCSPSHISNYLRGEERISRKVADKLKELYPELNKGYLMTGDGSLLIGGVQVRRIDQSHNSGNIANGGDIRQISGDAVLAVENAQLRERLEQARSEKDRLLGIIETLTAK